MTHIRNRWPGSRLRFSPIERLLYRGLGVPRRLWTMPSSAVVGLKMADRGVQYRWSDRPVPPIFEVGRVLFANEIDATMRQIRDALRNAIGEPA